jgi:small-conductance mechanosensitive channel
MLGKQWVRQYTNNLLSGGSYLIQARRHQYALEATERWRMSAVIRAIPIFTHLALFLFFIGLFIFLWGDDAATVGTVFSISLILLPHPHHSSWLLP